MAQLQQRIARGIGLRGVGSGETAVFRDGIFDGENTPRILLPNPFTDVKSGMWPYSGLICSRFDPTFREPMAGKIGQQKAANYVLISPT